MAKYDENVIRKIKREYENGKSISKLSKQFSVPMGTIKTWSSNNNWVKKKKNNQPKIKTVDQPTDQPTEDEIADLSDEVLITDIVDEVVEKEKVGKTYKVFTEKERMFVTYYFVYKFNVKTASLAVGYWSEIEGHRVLNKPKIQKVIRRIKGLILERAGINFTVDELLEELFLILKRATGEIPQSKVFLVSKFDKTTTPVPLRLEEKNKDGIITYKEVAKNEVKEKSWQVPEEYLVRDTDLKAANVATKLLLDLYGYMDNSRLAREKFNLEKEKYDEDKKEAKENESNSKNIIDELIGKADLNAKNNNT